MMDPPSRGCELFQVDDGSSCTTSRQCEHLSARAQNTEIGRGKLTRAIQLSSLQTDSGGCACGSLGKKGSALVAICTHALLRRGTQPATMTLQAAKDSAREWFARGLRGGNQHGPAARAKLCKQLAGQLQEHAASVCSSATAAHIASVLERGRPEEEGPLICATMARELRGSRYEGLWISRKGPAGHYYLGDEHEGANLPSTDKDGDPIHPRVHAVVKVVNEQLVISGFFLDPEDDTMSPAKVPIGPFLSVYFEGMSVREASAAWKGGPPARPRPAPKVKQGSITDPKLKELQAGLPPGWEVRESRSKKGIYFFAHPSSGRSQMERPRA
eukprot:s3564_g2.t1